MKKTNVTINEKSSSGIDVINNTFINVNLSGDAMQNPLQKPIDFSNDGLKSHC